MNKDIQIHYDVPDNLLAKKNDEYAKAKSAWEDLMKGNLDMTGWLDYTKNIKDDLIDDIMQMAENVRNKFSALVVVGIGGSYLGAKAAEDFLIRDKAKMQTKIYYAGINLSSDYHEKILREIEDEEVALCIISKSGGTTETLIAGNIFMDYLRDRYGESSLKERIFIVTDPQDGKLRKLAEEEKYPALPIPSDIGGRFSVLTPVGLFPMAVSGIDIKAVIRGANSAMKENMEERSIDLAAYRNALEGTGYEVELFASFEPCLTGLVQWIKQLYGESEGKDGKGMLPVDLGYTRDLHSLGQFVQDGRKIFSETFISIGKSVNSIYVPGEWCDSERDMSMAELNNAAKIGVMRAHRTADVPVAEMVLPEREPYTFGQAVYFFQKSCAIRGLMMGVNPFDQPGVEKYKKEMRNYLQI